MVTIPGSNRTDRILPLLKVCKLPHCSHIICIPYLLYFLLKLLDEGYGCNAYIAMARESPWVVLSEQQYIAIDKQL